MPRLKPSQGYTKDAYRIEQEANYRDMQEALRRVDPTMSEELVEEATQVREPLMDNNFHVETASPLRDIVPLRDKLESESEEDYFKYMNRNLLEEASGTNVGVRDPGTVGSNVFNPNAPKMDTSIVEDETPIQRMLQDPDPEGNLSTRDRELANRTMVEEEVPDLSFEKISRMEEGRSLDTMRRLAKKVVKTFDGAFAGEMTGSEIEVNQRINNFLKANPNIKAQHVEEVLYKITNAAEIARGSAPIELGGTLMMAYMHDLNRRQKTASRDILELEGMPDTKEEIANLSVQQRRGVTAVESNAFYSGWDSDNNVAVEGSTVGRLIFQAANIESDGNENALLGEMAAAVVPRALKEDYFSTQKILRPDNTYEAVVVLNERGMNFVDKNRSLFNHILRIPDKAPRVGKENLIIGEVTKADLRLKGALKEKSFVDKEAEAKFAKSMQIADNTGFTVQETGFDMIALLGGVDAANMSSAPNAVSHLLDGKKFKKIKLGGELNERTRSYEITHLDGSVEEVMNHSDNWKDEIFKRDMVQAKGTQGDVFYYNHFLGGNWRLYVDSVTLNYQAFHHVRANLGHQTQIPFNLNNKKHMTFLKSGIMRKSGLGPADSILKYESMSVQEGNKAFDAIIAKWDSKYGTLVRTVSRFNTMSVKEQSDFRMELKNPNSEIALAAKDLLEYTGGTGKYDKDSDLFAGENAANGYYGINAIVEAVKLKDSIDDPNKKAYATNFMFEADGVANGLAINAMFSGANDILKKTGLSEGIVAGYLHENNLLSEKDLYLTLNDEVIQFLRDNDTNIPNTKSLNKLVDILVDSGLLSRDLAKKPLMITSYSAGKDLVIKKIEEAVKKRLDSDSGLLTRLDDAGWGDIEAVVKELGDAYWNSIEGILGEVGAYAKVQQKFVTEMLRQKALNPNLPDPHVLMGEGNRIHTGVYAPTITGPEMEVLGKPVRQVTNKLDSAGQGINKETGEFTGYAKAPVAWNPVITHSMDQLQRRNVDLRSNLDWESLFSKYKTKDGTFYVDPNGGFMGQIFDGYLGSPYFMEEMDMILNEEFMKLGDRKSNLTSMIDTAKSLGYDMTTPGKGRMHELVQEMGRLQRKARANMRDNIRNGGNFPILNGVKSTVVKKGAEYKRTFEYDKSIAAGLDVELATAERYAIPETKPKKWSVGPLGIENRVENPSQSAQGVRADEIFGDNKFKEGQLVFSEASGKIGTVTRLPGDALFVSSTSDTPSYGITLDFSEEIEAGEWKGDVIGEWSTEESDLVEAYKGSYVMNGVLIK